MRYSSLNKLDIEELGKKYHSGIKMPELIKMFNKSEGQLYYLMRNNGIKPNRNISGKNIKNLTQEEIDHIIALYAEGINSTLVGKSLGISHTLVLKVIDTFSDLNHTRRFRIRKYKNINEHFFDIIDTEEKAYFL